MSIRKVFTLFEEKLIELFQSNFSQNLAGSSVTIKWETGQGFESNLRRGPDYEAIKNFVTTFRNFILDTDSISIRNIAKIYDQLPDGNDLKERFNDARTNFNNFLDAPIFIEYNSGRLTGRKIIELYIYGDVIHLNKYDEFKALKSLGPMNDVVFYEIVNLLGKCGEFIRFFNGLNQEYLRTELN